MGRVQFLQTGSQRDAMLGPLIASSLYMPLEARAPWEFGAALASMAAMPMLRRVEDCDGHAVVIYPGLVGSDLNTLRLRMFLSECGYDVHGWDESVNMGPCAEHDGAQHRTRAPVAIEERAQGEPRGLEPGWPVCARDRPPPAQ